MFMNPTLSVIVPAYNVAPWLSRCLDSILSQTYHNLEIIAIDDGSTDETPKIIEEYAKKDGRIVAVHQENAGLPAVRNRGICLASGDWIGFVDGDDAIEPDLYRRLLENALKYDADISHCGIRFCFPDGREEMHYETGRKKIQSHFEGLKDLLEGTRIEPSLCNKLYRASLMTDSCLDETIFYNEDLLRNFVLFGRAKRSVYEDFCGYRYEQRKGSGSEEKNKIVPMMRQITCARRRMVDHSSEDIYPYAMGTWLGSLVNTVNILIDSEESEAKTYCLECLKVLRKEREHFSFLRKRQRWAAGLMLFSPALYRLVYHVYKKKKRRK